MFYSAKLAACLVTAGACVGSVSHWVSPVSSPSLKEYGKHLKTVGSVQTAIPEHISTPSVPSESKTANQSVFGEFLQKLNQAEGSAAQLTTYTAVLEKQEEVQGELQDAEAIDVKMRHEPFSVYMCWHDDGKEVLFVDGKNDNRLLAKPTKGIAALKVWKLDPESRQAQKNSRYPITESGLHKLAKRVANFYQSRPEGSDGLVCLVSDSRLSGHETVLYEVRFENPDASPEYSRSCCYFDKGTGLLIGLENYGWAKDHPESPLVERYVYRDLKCDAKLAESDFDAANPEYAFRSDKSSDEAE